jgi:hypothetical protein
MKKTMVSLLSAATIVVMVAGTATTPPLGGSEDGDGGQVLPLASSAAPSSPAPSLPRGLLAMFSTTAMRRRFRRQAAIGRPGLSTMVRAASSAILASRCKSAPGTLAVRPGMLAVHLLAIRSPPACSASGHTIRIPEPIWATMASAIPVREPHC